MNLVYNISQFQLPNLFFLETKRNIILDGKFTKIIYSDSVITTNGIYLITPFKIIGIETYMNKNFLKFQIENTINSKIIDDLVKMEQYIIEYYKHLYKSDKKTLYLLKDQLYNSSVKLYKDSSKKNENSQYMVKISGIWEDYEKIGLTYKFMEIYQVNKFL